MAKVLRACTDRCSPAAIPTAYLPGAQAESALVRVGSTWCARQPTRGQSSTLQVVSGLSPVVKPRKYLEEVGGGCRRVRTTHTMQMNAGASWGPGENLGFSPKSGTAAAVGVPAALPELHETGAAPVARANRNFKQG